MLHDQPADSCCVFQDLAVEAQLVLRDLRPWRRRRHFRVFGGGYHTASEYRQQNSGQHNRLHEPIPDLRSGPICAQESVNTGHKETAPSGPFSRMSRQLALPERPCTVDPPFGRALEAKEMGRNANVAAQYSTFVCRTMPGSIPVVVGVAGYGTLEIIPAITHGALRFVPCET